MLRRKIGVALSVALVCGCGGDPEKGSQLGSGSANGSGNSGGAAGSDGNPFAGGDAGFGANDGSAIDRQVIALRIEPADAVLDVSLGQAGTLEYKAFARLASDPDNEIELTNRTVFYVPDNYLVASFPGDGDNTLTTRVPSGAGELPQRGGSLTVQAQTANADGTITTATTALLVKLSGSLQPSPGSGQAMPTLPATPEAAFAGSPTPARAPELVYPNDGVLLPPNLGRLEVHFLRGAPENTLFELRFRSSASELSYYTRCYSNPDEFVAEACMFALTGDDFEFLAASNRGAGPVQLSVRGSDENGLFGESSTFGLEFAEERIDGAVYYWTASQPPSINRFDFGSGQAEPEAFITGSGIPQNNTTVGNCVGCHALSRQGDKILLGLDGPKQGQLVFVRDMSRNQSDDAFFTYNGAALDKGVTPMENQQNRVLNASFNPDGSAFVAAEPANVPSDATLQSLFFHDAVTGERTGSITLPVMPNNPDWSPSGDKIAFTAINGARDAGDMGVMFMGGGISYIQQANDAWDAQNVVNVVPAVGGKSRFSPAFVPDGSLLLYSEVDQASYGGSRANSCNETNVSSDGRLCNGYSDPGAKTWAVAPAADAAPVFLARAAAPGVADGIYPPPQDDVAATDLMDTFPKAAPFQISHRGTTLGWFTVGSQRRAGLRKFSPNISVVGEEPTQALLWMFALDTDRVKGGEDGSYPGFFLPFQDLRTSNHMAQWTASIVSDNPPPPAPTPPPPAPPPPVILR
jgi:hypothetical protein